MVPPADAVAQARRPLSGGAPLRRKLGHSVHGRRLPRPQRADLRDAFEASALPFRVEVVELAGLAEGMRERVLGEAVALTPR